MVLQQIGSNKFSSQDTLVYREIVKQRLGLAISEKRQDVLEDTLDLKGILVTIKKNRDLEYI